MKRIERLKAQEILKMNGIDMLYVGSDYINENEIREFLLEYGNWRVGDSLKLKDSIDITNAGKYNELLSQKEWTIKQFILLHTIKLVGFDGDVCIDWFEKII